jgi:hypothetical protein
MISPIFVVQHLVSDPTNSLISVGLYKYPVDLRLGFQDPVDGFFDADSGLRFFWNLCPDDKKAKTCDDATAAVCVYKVGGGALSKIL